MPLRVAIVLVVLLVSVASSVATALRSAPPSPSPPRRSATASPAATKNSKKVVVPTATSTGLRYGETYLVGNRKNPKGLVTIAHGLGFDGASWKPFAEHMYERFPKLLIAMPSAPSRQINGFGGAFVPAWFEEKQDTEVIIEASSYVKAVSASLCEQYKIPPTNVVYGGYDQGAAVSLHAGLTAPYRPRGLFSIAGYLAAREDLDHTLKHRDVPIFMGHGELDGYVHVLYAGDSYESLVRSFGFKESSITYKLYECDHSVPAEEVADFVTWFRTLTW